MILYSFKTTDRSISFVLAQKKSFDKDVVVSLSLHDTILTATRVVFPRCAQKELSPIERDVKCSIVIYHCYLHLSFVKVGRLAALNLHLPAVLEELNEASVPEVVLLMLETLKKQVNGGKALP